MTLHSKVNYQCKFCQTYFVPIPEAPYCPKCNRKSRKVFPNFINETLGSVLFNLSRYHRVIPPAWYTGTIGDYYYRNAFAFLTFVCAEVPVSRRKILKRTFDIDEIDSLTNRFLDLIEFGEQAYRRDGLKVYLSLILSRDPVQSQQLAEKYFFGRRKTNTARIKTTEESKPTSLETASQSSEPANDEFQVQTLLNKLRIQFRSNPPSQHLPYGDAIRHLIIIPQFKGKPFSQLIEFYLEQQGNTRKLREAAASTAAMLPKSVQPLVADFIDRWNEKAYEKSFWQRDTWDVFSEIMDDARSLLSSCEETADDKTLVNMIQVVVLSYAYSASGQPKMREFIGIRSTQYPWMSAMSLLYPILAVLYIAARTDANLTTVIGYGFANLGYVMFAAGIFAGTYRILGLRKRWQVIAGGITSFLFGTLLSNIAG